MASRLSLFVVCLVGFCPVFSIADELASTKKLIATGVDAPTPAQFRAHFTDFEKWGFDGTVIQPTRRLENGRTVEASYAFSAEHWDFREYASTIENLRAVRPGKARSNFLILHANPGMIDWFDDRGWAEIVDHWGLLARVAREGGLRGVVYDPEPYTPPWSQFDYRKQPNRGKHAFSDYAVKARERGREVMRAVIAEYPDITILAYRLLCDLLPTVVSRNPTPLLAQETYGLAPAFVDGWLDVLPASAVLVDGNERSYLYDDASDFSDAYTQIRIDSQALLSPENRIKFRAQCQVAHALYLDAYCNPPSSPWYIDPRGSSPVARLAANAAAALAASDEYVWVYGEKGRWWPSDDPKYQLWTERLPGVDRALQDVRDPLAAARRRLASAAPSENRVLNGSFSEAHSAKGPRGWTFWQGPGSKGNCDFADDPSGNQGTVAVINEATNACLVQDIAVKPGEVYAVGVKMRNWGLGFVGIKVRWQKKSGSWVEPQREIRLVPSGQADGAGWQECMGLLDVPEADSLVLMLFAKDQHLPSDTVWFDDAKLVRMDIH